jgi:hypothetical protein
VYLVGDSVKSIDEIEAWVKKSIDGLVKKWKPEVPR